MAIKKGDFVMLDGKWALVYDDTMSTMISVILLEGGAYATDYKTRITKASRVPIDVLVGILDEHAVEYDEELNSALVQLSQAIGRAKKIQEKLEGQSGN